MMISIVIVAVCIVLTVLIYLYVEANSLSVTRFVLHSDDWPFTSEQPFTIVHLTDLHSKSFGPNNERLVKAIERERPDLIVVTGDMYNAVNDTGEVFLTLVDRLARKHPIYIVDGNHEQLVGIRKEQQHQLRSYRRQLHELGAVYLNDEIVEWSREGVKIHIAGLNLEMHYYRPFWRRKPELEPIDRVYVEHKLGRKTGGRFTILLTHNPDYFPAYAAWGADLIFAGHHHGGMIRLPYFGGLIMHDARFMPPKYDAGLYELGRSTMIVGRGLGNHSLNIRVWNKPEIVVVQLRR